MTFSDLKEMSRSDKILVLMAYDVYWMPRMNERPAARFGAVYIALKGRKGYFDYLDEELDSELEDYAPDFASMGSCDRLVAWAQETSGVQCVDLASESWTRRTVEGYDSATK